MNATLPDLDQETRDELQPPCEFPKIPALTPCQEAATWIVWFSHQPSRKLLSCDEHKARAEQHLATCPGHRGAHLCSEPLR